MSSTRPRTLIAVASLAVALCAVNAALAPSPAAAHHADPHYLSELRAVRPPIPGLEVEIVNRGDQIELRDRGRRTVVVDGYVREPYLRFLPNGVVQRNVNSPATYLNDSRDGSGHVPASAKAGAAPRWTTISEDGVYRWHDHRIHWMGRGTPDVVKDESKPAKVFDWHIPVVAGGRSGAIVGELRWTPEGGGPSLALVVGLAIAVIAAFVLMLVVLRRRLRHADDEAVGERTRPTPDEDAW